MIARLMKRILETVRAWIWVIAVASASVACGPAIGGRPRQQVSTAARRATAPQPAHEEQNPAHTESERTMPVTYETLLERERVADPLATQELRAGEQRVHFVLERGRCYRIVSVADQNVSLELRDENARVLANESGRVVRFSAICPRWTGSFELRAEVSGERGQIWLHPAQPSASSTSSEVTNAMIR